MYILKTYRGVDFFINDVCAGLRDNVCPEHFSRYFTKEEMALSSPKNSVEQRVEIIKKAIDRMIARKPVYTGDLRERT